MKSIHLHKVYAITKVKFQAFFGKNCIIMPLFSIGFTLVFRFLYQYVLGDGKMTDDLAAYVMSLGVVMNIGMTGIYCTSLLLAEEKEKRTLRVLMMSSVNAVEFFIGSILPAAVSTIFINFLLMPVSGYRMTGNALLIYTGITVLSTLISTVIGMLVGIFAKDQVSTGTLITPVLLVLMFIPMFGELVDVLAEISKYLFTGVIMEMILNLAAGEKPFETVSIIAMVFEFVAAVLLFTVFYRRNGYEKD